MSNKSSSRVRFFASIVGLAFAVGMLFANPSPAAQAKPATQKPAVVIMLTSKPSPPSTGENTFEVMVKDATGKAITDADVTATLYMAGMGAMPEMKNTITLKHQKNGTYAGTGQVMMAGKWDVTVTAKRAGKEIGSKKFPLTAK